MALHVRNIRQIFRQTAIRNLIQKRLLGRLITSPAQPLLAKSTKPSFIQWNSSLDLNNGTPVRLSNSEFHHLAEYTLICNIAYLMKIGRNFAKATGQDGPKLGSRATPLGYNDSNTNTRLAAEKKRLKNKGVMKNIPIKVPEGADHHRPR